MTVLSTFLESSLNFLFNNIKNTTKFGKVREKSGVKVWPARNTLWFTTSNLPVKWHKK